MLNMSSVERDRTARAVIRDAALRLFAEHGPEATSVRAIASAAQVSPALVLHHFGSKQGLREAVDARVAAAFEEFFDLERPEDVAAMLTDVSGSSFVEVFNAAFPPDSPLPAYLRRLLLTGDPAATAIFVQWHHSTMLLLETLEQMGLARPAEDAHTRAAFTLAADLAVLLLRAPLSAALDYDPMSADGIQRYAREVQRIYTRGIYAGDLDTDTEGGRDHDDRRDHR